MKIALMTNNYKPFMGGVPISVERLKNGLQNLGHEVVVFAPTYENQKEEKDVFRYRTLLSKFIGGIVLPDPFDKGIKEIFEKERFDMIHVHHPMLIGRTAVYLSRKYNIPLAFTYHTRYEQYLFGYVKVIKALDSLCNGWIEKTLFPLYLNLFFKHCNHIFAPTVGMEQYLQRICGILPEKISVLPTGIEKSAYEISAAKVSEIRKKYHVEEIPLFLSVSRMAKEKNVEFLLESIAITKKKAGNSDFKVLLIGDGPDRIRYESMCMSLQIADNVIFTGQIPNEEIAPYFAAADAFIFASKTETQGIVILEAFAGHTPVYAVNASGVSDLVEDEWNGRLCEENAEAFAEILLQHMKNSSEVESFGQNAYETALDFQEDAVAAKAVEQYNKVIAACSGAHQQLKVRTEALQGTL